MIATLRIAHDDFADFWTFLPSDRSRWVSLSVLWYSKNLSQQSACPQIVAPTSWKSRVLITSSHSKSQLASSFYLNYKNQIHISFSSSSSLFLFWLLKSFSELFSMISMASPSCSKHDVITIWMNFLRRAPRNVRFVWRNFHLILMDENIYVLQVQFTFAWVPRSETLQIQLELFVNNHDG